MQKTRILVVDDQEAMRRSLAILLERQGYEVLEAESGEAAVRLLGSEAVDLVITDLKMDEINGIGVLKSARETNPDAEVIVMTAFGTVSSAVEAMKLGAYDYVTKPFDTDQMLLAVGKAVERKGLVKQVKTLRRAFKDAFGIENIVGRSAPMRSVLETSSRVAESDATVLISGESGTGKELVARAIHNLSSRRDGAFMPVDCGAIPALLLESELFGHVKGAFTDAKTHKNGLFQEADGGSLFLDEVGELPLELQPKLLRALQEYEIRKIGDTKSIKIDVRLIAATNRDLEEAVKAGRFREDLFYRLNVIRIRIPPLRERTEDIPLLVSHLLKKIAAKHQRPVPDISPEAVKLIESHSWPGNVRELENAIEHAMVLSRGEEITEQDLPVSVTPVQAANIGFSTSSSLDPPAQAASIGFSTSISLDQVEREHILNVLKSVQGNRLEAARVLGIGRATLWRKLKEYNIEEQV